MPQQLLRWRIGAGFLAAVVLFSLLAVDVQAQEGQLVAESDLNKFDGVRVRSFRPMMFGEHQPTKADQKDLELAAQYYIYYMTLKTRQSDPDDLYKRRTEFNRDIDYIMRYAAKNKTFRTMLAKELRTCFQRVLERGLDSDRIAFINVALMLPKAAELSSPEFGEFLSELVQNAKDDVARLFAFQALQVQYQKLPPRLDRTAENKERVKEAARVQPLVDFVLKVPAELAKAAIEQQDGFRYVRTEAIRALGKTRVPAFAELKDLKSVSGDFNGKIMAPVAYTLLKVLAEGKDQVSPAPSFEEKCEAAIALCYLDGKTFDRYNPDLAVGLIGKFLVDFTLAYSKDREAYTANSKPPVPPRYNWKTLGEQLRQGLVEWEKNVPADSKAVKHIQDIRKAANLVFDQTKRNNAVEAPTELRRIVSGLPASAPEVYRDAEYKIQLK